MPIAPPPSQWHCPQCGWTTSQFHTSDALWGGPSECKRCGHAQLNRKSLTGLQATLSEFTHKTLSKFFK